MILHDEGEIMALGLFLLARRRDLKIDEAGKSGEHDDRGAAHRSQEGSHKRGH